VRARSLLGFLLLALCHSLAAQPVDACRAGPAYIHVDTKQHRLWLCDASPEHPAFTVRLGSAGTGKSREGDQRTPLGRYRLGTPRASSKFVTFIPIEYPTAQQRKQGYTGSGIGIHGLHRALLWLAAYGGKLDTTNGCVVISDDAELTRIASWVGQHRVAVIELD
jgi:murein L,D-transpeptidase YafK